MEEIVIAEELTPITKHHGRTASPIPTVTINNANMYFNLASENFLKFDAIRWYFTSKYLVGLPTEADDRDGFVLQSSNSGITASTPKEIIQNKMMKNGKYKVYKYQNGIAIKRYEQM